MFSISLERSPNKNSYFMIITTAVIINNKNILTHTSFPNSVESLAKSNEALKKFH